MNSISIRRTVIVAALALTLAASEARAQSYSFQTIDDPSAEPGGGTLAWGISGNTVLGSYGAASGNGAAFLYNTWTSSWATLPTPSSQDFPPPSGASAVGISGNYVVGTFTTNVVAVTADVYDTATSTFSYIIPPGFDAYGVTKETVGGVSGNLVGGSYQSLEQIGQSDVTISTGYIDNITTGGYTTFNDPLASSGPAGGTYVSGFDGSYAVGSYALPTDDYFTSYGMLYNVATGIFTTIADPAGTNTVLTAVSGNEVLGSYSDASNFTHYFLYNISTGSFTALPSDPLSVGQSYGQNGTYYTGIDGSTLVGYYLDSSSDVHGFIATVPEPSSCVLLVLGAIGVAAMAARGCVSKRAG